MSEMVERVARVICETQNVDGFKCTCPLLGEIEGNNWCNGNRAVAQARAAIAAMREPTEAMKDADGVYWEDSCLHCGGHQHAWQTLIDAALKE
jgi:hypothetical protein